MSADLQGGVDRLAQTLIEPALDDGLGSAVALGVVCGDGERAVACRGVTRLWQGDETSRAASVGRPITRGTCFDLASLTKPMCTSTLWAQLVDSGVADLGQPLEALLPEARGLPLGGASLAQLLGHASGAPAWRDFAAEVRPLPREDRPAALRRRVLETPLERPAGSAAVYSDLGFLALGWALEAALGAPLDALFARRIAEPLGLASAHFRRRHAGSDEAIVATEVWPVRCLDGRPLQGQVHDDNCAALDGVAGHAGLFASVDDVLTWAQTWLCSGRGKRGTGVVPARAAASWPTLAAAPDTTWRLAWDTPSSGASTAGALVGEGAFGHLGFTGTSVWVDPSRDAAVVLLTNRVHPSRASVAGIRALRPRVHDAIWRLIDGDRGGRAAD